MSYICKQDEGDNPLSGSITVTVTLSRPNPNAPVFTANVYSADIPESLSSFTVQIHNYLYDNSVVILSTQTPQFVVTVRADDPAHDTANVIDFFIDTCK